MPAYQKLGRYYITHEIARGGMAVIYKAFLTGVSGFSKDVAIKQILPSWSVEQEFIDMLIDEAKVLVKLNHQNIVQIFELAKEEKSYYIVMEFVNGWDLRNIIRAAKKQKQKLPLKIITFILFEILKGLEFAHSLKDENGNSANLVHRDISPQNILVSRHGDVKITDFGIAKITGKTQNTATGILKGKFSYMSPEQALGQNIDHQTDIFALGCVLFEMLFSEKCFDEANDFATIEKVRNVDFKIPENSYPIEILEILKKCLHKNKADRFTDARELRKVLEQFIFHHELNSDQWDLENFLKDLFLDKWFELSSYTNTTPLFESEHAEHAKETILENFQNHNENTIVENQNFEETIFSAQTVIENTATQNSNELTKTQFEDKTIIRQHNENTKTQLAPTQLHDSFSSAKTVIASDPELIKKTKKTSSFKTVRLDFFLILFLVSAFFFYKVFYTKTQTLKPKEPNPVAQTQTQKTNTILKKNDQNLTAQPKDPYKVQIVPKSNVSLKNTNTQIPVTLKKEIVYTKGTFSIQSVPKDAKLTVTYQGKTKDITSPFIIDNIMIKPDEKIAFTVQAKHEDYFDFKKTYEITDKAPVNAAIVKMEKLTYGYLSVKLLPWGVVRIDGKKTNGLPKNLKLVSGEHKLKISNSSFRKATTKTIKIEPNKTLKCLGSFGSRTRLSCKTLSL